MEPDEADILRLEAEIDQVRAAIDDPDTPTDADRHLLIHWLHEQTDLGRLPDGPIPARRWWLLSGRAHLIERIRVEWAAEDQGYGAVWIHDAACPGCLNP